MIVRSMAEFVESTQLYNILYLIRVFLFVVLEVKALKYTVPLFIRLQYSFARIPSL